MSRVEGQACRGGRTCRLRALRCGAPPRSEAKAGKSAQPRMSKRFTVVSLALTAIVAFLVGAIVAGGAARSSVTAGLSLPRAASLRSAVRAGGGPSSGSLVNFADVVERINPAVVNIDATA